MPDNSLEDWIATRGISVDDAIASGLAETDTPHVDVHPSLAYLDGYPGVVIPYVNADGSPLLVEGAPYARMRRLGVVPEGAPKYIQGAGTGVHVYLCPFIDWTAVFASPKIPIVVTEGEAKAIALCAQGVACVALGGVSATRDKATGEYLPGTRGCVWAGRLVYICFDSDTASNLDVFAAQEKIRAELSVRRDADVRIVRLPGKPAGFDQAGNPLPDEKVGIDDFLLWRGIGELKKLMHAAPSASKLDRAILEVNETAAIIDDEEAVYDEVRDQFYSVGFFKAGSRFSHLKIPVVAMGKNGPVDRPPIEVSKEWMTHPNARRFAGTVFKPGKERLIDTPRGPLLNRWQGFRAEAGDVQPFLDLTSYIFSELDAALQDFPVKLLAYKAQHPGEKIPIALFLVGTKGSGKSMWCEMMRKAFDPASAVLQPDVFNADHNPYIERNVLLFIDEVSAEVMRNHGEALKLLATAERMMLNEKYRPQKQVDNLSLLLLATNSPEAAAFSRDERRYLVVRCPDAHENSAFYLDYLVPYFTADCGPAIMHYLLNYDLQGWRPPANAPMTQARYSSYYNALDPVAQLAEQIATSNENTVYLWVEAALQWARDIKASLPANAPLNLLRRIQQVDAVVPQWPIRPFYSTSELGLLFPGMSEQLMGNRQGRVRHYTPQQIASGLIENGVKPLKSADPRGFRYGGVMEPFLIVYDVNNPLWKKQLTQSEFEDLINSFGTYAELPGAKVAAHLRRHGS